MSARHAAPAVRTPGDRLIALGAALFGIGLVAVLVAVVPALLGESQEAAGLPAVLSGVLLPLGFGLALGGLLRGARSRRRAARRAARS